MSDAKTFEQDSFTNGETKRAGITVCEIAKRVKVSPSTVSFVLTGQAKKRRISDRTANLVLDSAKKLGYVPNMVAQSLRNQRTGVVSLLIGNLEHSWAELTVKGANSVFDDLDYHSSISLHYWDRDREKTEMDLVIRRRDEGIICQPVLGARQDYENIIQNGVPLVLLDILPDMPGVSYVSWDAAPAARAMMKYLIDSGRKRIKFIGYDVMTLNTISRHRAYLQMTRESGQQPDSKWLSWGSFTDHELKCDDIKWFENEIRSKDKADAFFCLNDYTALMVLRILKKLNVKVPDDVAVTGMGDLPITHDFAANLTTVKEPIEEIGRVSAEVMLELINNGSNAPIQKLVESNDLKIRKTA